MTYPFTVPSNAAEEPANDTNEIALAAGDLDAFAVIYRKHVVQVYRYLLTRTAGPEDAADLTQQTFLNAFRSMHRYQPHRDGFAPWLFRIARNAAIDGMRRKGMPTGPLDERVGRAGGPDPEAAVLASERMQELRALISQLDKGQQDILALRFAGELSVPQIAGLLGKSEAAARKQLWRAIRTLKELSHEDTLPRRRA